MKARRLGVWSGWGVVLFCVGVWAWCASCATTRGPSPEESARIMAAIQEDLAGRDATVLNQDTAKMRVREGQATVEYTAHYRMAQLAFSPMKAELELRDGQWVVVEQKSNRSWLGRLALKLK